MTEIHTMPLRKHQTLPDFLIEEAEKEERLACAELDALQGWVPTWDVKEYRIRQANRHKARADRFRKAAYKLLEAAKIKKTK